MEKPDLNNIDKLMLMQPNNITFGEYSYSSIQENILTLAIEALQKHATKEKLLQTDLWGQPTITVVCDEAAGDNNKNLVVKAVKDMVKKPFNFKWVHPNMGKVVETGGVVFTTWHNIIGSNRIELTLNVWAIPYLVYYGVGVGGTRFNKSIALNLQGEYTKRIYKMVCRWHDQLSFPYPLSSLRKDLDIPDSYDNTKIETVVLKPAVEKITESGSDITFEYELICKNKIKGRKPKADTIIFKIINKNPKEAGGAQFETYKDVFNFLSGCWSINKSSKLHEIVDKLCSMGVLDKVSKRIEYYQTQIKNDDLTLEHARNKIKKMLKDEYQLS